MLDLVRMWSRSWPMTVSSKRLAFEPRRGAGLLAGLDEGLADVVGVLATLRLGGRERSATALALHQPAQQIGAGGAAGMDDLRSAGLDEFLHALELFPAHYRGDRALDAHRRRLAPGPLPPRTSVPA